MIVLLLFGLGSATTIPPLPACETLRFTYSSRGVPEYDIPGKPVQGLGLQFCPSGPTCCTRSVEEKLGAWSEKQYRDAIFNRTTSMAADIDRKAQKIDDYVYSLLNAAQRGFHDMFTRTYGIMYQNHADLFQEFFKDLKVYYDKGTLDLGRTTNLFFDILYQKMFQVLNSQYKFDSLYMSCVSENMKELNPFGDVPRKLASSVKRSMVAARALVRALKTGHEIANVLTKVEPSSGCLNAVKRMSSCPACKGLPEVKPCNGYCINIMKGCMAHHYNVNTVWNEYIESLLRLTDRLIGPFNVEMTIQPISIKISDAIMNFQESGFQVTQKVFELCGTPRLGRSDPYSSRMARDASSLTHIDAETSDFTLADADTTQLRHMDSSRMARDANSLTHIDAETSDFTLADADTTQVRHTDAHSSRMARDTNSLTQIDAEISDTASLTQIDADARRLTRRDAQASQFVFEKRLEKIHRTPARPTKSEFEIMLIDLKRTLKQVEGFWSLLPYQMCDTQMSRPYRNIRDRTSCWNGKDVGKYEEKVLEDGLDNQVGNPEVTVAPSESQALLGEQEAKLAGLTNQLRAAYRGLEIEWWDDTARGGVEGSGGGGAHPDLFDDEDYGDDDDEGSGEFEGSGREDDEEEYDEAPIPAKPWNPWKTTTKAPPAVVEREPVVVVTAGAPRLSVYKAVTVLILPAVTCYLGGVATSLPFFLS